MFSRMQRRNVMRGSPERIKENDNAVALLEFALELARKQARAGRYFVLEHPASAESWYRRVMVALACTLGVEVNRIDMCAYGLKSEDAQGVGPGQKADEIVKQHAVDS